MIDNNHVPYQKPHQKANSMPGGLYTTKRLISNDDLNFFVLLHWHFKKFY